MMQDAFPRTQRFVHHDAAHRIGQCKGQLVRLGIAQADGEASLRIGVDQQDFLSRPCEGDTQVCGSRGLAHAALLVDNGSYFTGLHKCSFLLRNL